MRVQNLVPLTVLTLLTVVGFVDHYFRDEFYYLACSRRMAWGYVDQPPLSIAILWLIRHLAGDSLIVLRVATALVAAGSVWLTGRIAARLGASDFGQALAMIAAAIAPELLSTGSFYSMNVFDVFLWTLAMGFFLDALDRPGVGPWIRLGVVLGLGLLNKISMMWLGAGMVAGLLSTGARRQLATAGPWIALAIAVVMFAPHLVWQIANGWPTLEFMHNASADKMQSNPPLAFLADQVMNMHPLTLPIWLAGLVFLLFHPRVARYRPLGIAFVAVAAIVMANRTSRSGYLAPGYPVLFAAGAMALEPALRHRALRIAVIALLVVGGAASAPLAVPLLPVETYVRYSRALGVAPDTEEKKELGRLPQFFADRQGWDAMVDQVAAVFESLPPEERARAAVITGNYGEQGAVEQLGRSRGLVAISGHNNCWLWGPAGRTGDVLIVLSRSRERQEQRFESVEVAGTVECGDCMPYENGLSIFVCRNMKPPALPERWSQLKHYD